MQPDGRPGHIYKMFSIPLLYVTCSLKIPKIPLLLYAKQKHLGCKKVRGQSEATLQTSMCDQKLCYQLRPRSYFTKTVFNSLNDIHEKKVAK